MKKILIGLAAVVVLVGGGGFLYLSTLKPAQRPPSTERVEATPERVERGRYLVEAVVGCFGCHSEFELDHYTFPIKEGTKGAGGFCFDKENAGFPGKVCAQNITQDKETGIGAWTDGEIMRAIREGVSRNGDALFPMMPYPYLRELSDEDARSIVAYLRTVAPVKGLTPKGFVEFPVSIFIKFAPRPLDGPVPEPNRKDPVAYGRYLARLACYDCHTPVDEQMQPIPDRAFAGGREFDFSKVVPGLKMASANLTRDETGLAEKTKEAFVGQFKSFADPELKNLKVPPDQNTLMPWLQLSQLTEEDLGAIYDYLRTVPAVKNAVNRRPIPSVLHAATPTSTATAAPGAW